MFDPYHKWLGIQPGQRPPTHYQLLGIAPAEKDPEVIEEAAVRQTTHVRTYQIGPHAKESTRVLNEIAQARATLLDPARRRAYDARLAKEAAARQAPAVTTAPRAAPVAAAPEFAFLDPPADTPGRKPAARGGRAPAARSVPSKRKLWMIGAGSAGLVLAAGALLWAFLPRSKDRPNPQPAPKAVVAADTARQRTPDPEPDPQPDPKPDPKPDPQPDPQPVARKGPEILTFGAQQAPVKQLVFASDGRHMLWISAYHAVSVLDAKTGKVTVRFPDGERFNCGAFSPDGRYVVLGSGEQVNRDGVASFKGCGLQLWEAETGRLVRRFEGHKAPVLAVAFSPDGSQIVSGAGAISVIDGKLTTWDCTVRLWRVMDGQELAHSQGAQYPIVEVTLTDHGRVFFSPESRSVQAWEPRSDKTYVPTGIPRGIRDVAFCPGGRQALLLLHDWTVRLWDLEKSEERARFKAEKASKDVEVLAVSGNGRRGVVAWTRYKPFPEKSKGLFVESIQVQILDLDRGQELGRLNVTGKLQNQVTTVALSPDGREAAFEVNHLPRLWDITKRSALGSVGTTPDPVVVSPKPEPEPRSVRREGPEILEFDAPSGPMNKLVFAPDGRHVLCISRDHSASLLDGKSGHRIVSFPGDLKFNCGAFSPDSRYVVLGSGEQVNRDGVASFKGCGLRLCAVASGELVRRFEGHKAPVLAVAFSPDGSQIVSGAGAVTVVDGQLAPQDCTLRRWKVKDGQELARSRGGKHPITAVAQTENGRVLCHSPGQPIRVWEPTSLTMEPANGIPQPINGLNFCPGGRQALLLLGDKTIRLWDLEKSEERARFKPDQSSHRVGVLAVSGNGRRGTIASVRYKPNPIRGGQLLIESIQLRVLDLARGRELGHIDVPGKLTTGILALSHDGSRAVFEVDFISRLWDLSKLSPPGADPKPMPSDPVVVSPKPEPEPKPGPREGPEILKFDHRLGPVQQLVFAPDGRHVLCIPHHRPACLLDAKTGKTTVRFPDGERFNCGAFSTDSRYVVTGSGEEVSRDRITTFRGCGLQLWEVKSGRLVRRFEGHEAPVRAVAFSPDGTQVVSGAGAWTFIDGKQVPRDCTVRRWRVMDGKELARSQGMEYPIKALTLTQNGRVFCHSQGFPLLAWGPRRGKLVPVKGIPEPLNGLAFCPGGRQALLLIGDGTIRLWDLEKSRQRARFKADKASHSLEVLAVSGNGRRGAVAWTRYKPPPPGGGQLVLDSIRVRVLDLEHGRELPPLDISGEVLVGVRTLALSPDGSQAVFELNYTPRLWDLTTRQAPPANPNRRP